LSVSSSINTGDISFNLSRNNVVLQVCCAFYQPRIELVTQQISVLQVGDKPEIFVQKVEVIRQLKFAINVAPCFVL
jgi:hypothetical protein